MGLLPNGSVHEAERKIEEHYFQVLLRILAISPFGLRQVLEATTRDLELRVLASLLKGMAEGMEEEALMSMITPFGKYDEKECRRLLETRSTRRAIELVADRYLRETLIQALGQVGLAHHQIGIEMSLQQASAKQLWSSTLFLTGRDAESVRHILGQYFDLQNLLLLTRSKIMEIPAGTVRSFMLPVSYRLKSSDLLTLASLSTVGDQVRGIRLTYYAQALGKTSFDAAPRSGVSLLETAFNRYFARQCYQAFSGSRFFAGLAIAFLFLKRFETSDLKAILTGKAAGLSSEEIREKIILHQGLDSHR